jgi:hypothetical protein
MPGAPGTAYESFAKARGLVAADGFAPGPVTPLLAKGGRLGSSYSGQLTEGVPGMIARYEAALTFNVVYAPVLESRAFIPRLVCERKGRVTDTTQYGFEIRSSRVWTESVRLNERFKVTTSPFQDDNWMLQLFSPTFIDWLGQQSPGDFSFEVAYGSLLCSIEENDPDEGRLAALWDASAVVAKRILEESRE